MPRAKKADNPKAGPQRDPNDVVRQSSGAYVSGDGRFEISQSQTNWYLLDRQQTNELGQELIHGPFGSLKEARAAMPGAREVKPLLRSRRRPAATPRPRQKPAPPPSWIDRLTPSQAAEVRRLIRALEREGIEKAEDLVRRDRQGNIPLVAMQLVERGLGELVARLPVEDRDRSTGLVDAVVRLLADSGAQTKSPLPGWALIETGPDRRPTPRRIRLRS